MNIFFDTSSLFKLYHEEEGTQPLIEFLNDHQGYKIFVSELTRVEIYSAILKKVRVGHLSLEQAEKFLKVIDNDLKGFSCVSADINIINEAQKLVVKYGLNGLRSLDAMQLASAISLKPLIELVLTNDNLLKDLFIKEGFNCNIDAF